MEKSLGKLENLWKMVISMGDNLNQWKNINRGKILLPTCLDNLIQTSLSAGSANLLVPTFVVARWTDGLNMNNYMKFNKSL